jgi:hypothetical protein
MIIVLLGTSISCSAGSSIVGKWNLAKAERTLISLMNQMECLSDGTFKTDFMNLSGKYSFKDAKHIMLLGTNEPIILYHSISGDTLTLEDEQGNTSHFQRSNYYIKSKPFVCVQAVLSPFQT